MTEDINPISSRTKQKQVLELNELHKIEIEKKEEDFFNRIENLKKSNTEQVEQKDKDLLDMR